MYIDKNEDKLFYEDISCKEFIDQKFGKSEYNPEEYKKLVDMTVVPKNGGFAIHDSESCYFLAIDSELKRVLPLTKINFKINKGQMTIEKICPCPDPSLIMISLVKNNDYIILVWDIHENKEVYNFSTSSFWSFIYGPGSKAGYILNGDTYVNMDKGLINYFFEYNFPNTGFYEQRCGYRINKLEDIILEYGNIITKETLIEVNSTDELICKSTDITEGNINLERIRFQVDGNTSLHYFALEYDKLKLILDYMEEHRPEYLTAILMKNNHGKSPLDITLDNESPKNTELLLRKLALFKDSSLSNLFYDRFSELLAMNVSAFHEYLDSCMFQTVQMKATKYLKLKKDKDPWLVPHSSCLIDEVFIEKYCRDDERKKLEAEKKKKEEEDKLKAEEQQREEERKAQLAEEVKGRTDELGNGEAEGEDEIKASLLKEDSENELLEGDSENLKRAKSKIELEQEKEQRKQKRLDIRAIEFDWIFNKDEGAKFLKTLAHTNAIDLFSLSVVRHIIMFCWSYFRKAIVIYLFIPYLIYFAIFTLYITYFHHQMIENDEGEFEGFGIPNFICNITLILFTLYFFFFELKQVIFHKLAYFVSFWNLIDMSSLILNMVIFISDLAGMKEANLISMGGIAVLLVYLRLFYFGRIFLATAAMIRMIMEITYDMRYFLLIFILAVAGFGNCFYILAKNLDTEERFTGNNYWRAFLYSFDQAMGNINTDAYAGTDKYLLYAIWFGNTMVTLIVFLNLLIAIMGDTFDRVQETAENNMLKELVSIMVENENLVNRKKIFGDAKYIIVIQEEQADEVEVNWEGRLQHLKKFMDKNVITQNKLLKALEMSITQEIKEKAEKKGKEMESSANKYFTLIMEKADQIQEFIDEKMLVYKPSNES